MTLGSVAVVYAKAVGGVNKSMVRGDTIATKSPALSHYPKHAPLVIFLFSPSTPHTRYNVIQISGLSDSMLPQ